MTSGSFGEDLDTLVKKTETTRYYYNRKNLVLDVDGLKKQKGNTNVAMADNSGEQLLPLGLRKRGLTGWNRRDD